MKKLSVLAGIALLGFLFFLRDSGRLFRPTGGVESSSRTSSDDLFASAFAEHRGNFVAEGEGTVKRILPDDNDGSRHQRFIVQLASGQTLLIAHNIDLAPRIEGLAVGDEVTFKGEYEWNDNGGVVHWTHLDPAATHEAGWILHEGKTYQ